MKHFYRSFRHISPIYPAAIISVVASFYIGGNNGFCDSNGKSNDDDDDDDKNRNTNWKISPPTTTSYCQAAGEQRNATTIPHHKNNDDRPRLVFLGTGSSTGCPKPICAMKFQKRNDDVIIVDDNSKKTQPQPLGMRVKPDSTSCLVSFLAIDGGDPKSNRNYRNNPSLLIHHYDLKSQNYKNIVIDVGKTFRETALRWFPIIEGIHSLDAIVLTHHHMDAAAGLDDVRGFQKIKWVEEEEEKENKDINNNTSIDDKIDGDEKRPETRKRGVHIRESIPLYMSDFCHLNLQSQFPWLLPNKSEPSIMPQQAKDRPTVKRDVASFDVTIFQDYKEETIFGGEEGHGFKITPLPVWHGDDLTSHGFAFSLHRPPSSSSLSSSLSSSSLNVVYLSDISKVIPETLDYIQKKLPPTDVLIVDSLNWEKNHPVHYSLEQAVELAQTIKPKIRTFLIGMSCDNFLPHDEMNTYLRELYGDGDDGNGLIVMAHDGLIIDLPTSPLSTAKHEK